MSNSLLYLTNASKTTVLHNEKTNGQRFHFVSENWQKLSVNFLLWLSISGAFVAGTELTNVVH